MLLLKYLIGRIKNWRRNAGKWVEANFTFSQRERNGLLVLLLLLLLTFLIQLLILSHSVV